MGSIQYVYHRLLKFKVGKLENRSTPIRSNSKTGISSREHSIVKIVSKLDVIVACKSPMLKNTGFSILTAIYWLRETSQLKTHRLHDKPSSVSFVCHNKVSINLVFRGTLAWNPCVSCIILPQYLWYWIRLSCGRSLSLSLRLSKLLQLQKTKDSPAPFQVEPKMFN